MLRLFLAWTNALENALITFISSEYLRRGIDLEHGLIERQVRVLEILVQLFLELLGIGRNRRLPDHDLGEASPVAGPEDRRKRAQRGRQIVGRLIAWVPPP